ncbi:MAG: cellulase family glycosylhydrolase, partial [Patulibacter sp.]|nr:cellulase family glycosylhydrolase [Patulibacter sp.]
RATGVARRPEAAHVTPPARRAGAVLASGLAAVALTVTVAGCGGKAAGRAVTDPTDRASAKPVAFYDHPEALTAADRLRVATADGARHLVDASGRIVDLRGVNVNGLVDYGPKGLAPIPVRTADFDQIAALGLNVVRLSVSWSKVMPSPGTLDRAYLAKITKLVRVAGRRHVYVVVSMHSDRYAAGLGTGTEFDGAPRWAVEMGGARCGDPRPRYYTTCAADPARHFYGNAVVHGRGLQAWYADALAAVATAAKGGGPAYSGVDILNEPTDPDANPDANATLGWRRELAALQKTLVARVRAAGDRAPIWLQPQGPRSTAVDAPAVLPSLADHQLVYAPHAYIDVYGTQPTDATQQRLPAQYEAFAAEAKQLGAALVVGEFPGAAGGMWEDLRALHLAEQRKLAVGGIAWLWKQPAAGYGWGTVKPDGSARADTQAAAVLGGARVVAGDPKNIRLMPHSDHSVTVTPPAGGPQTVDVWLGARFGAPDDDQLLYVLGDGSTAKVIGEWSQRAQTPAGTTTGTLVRLRLDGTRSPVRLAPDAP